MIGQAVGFNFFITVKNSQLKRTCFHLIVIIAQITYHSKLYWSSNHLLVNYLSIHVYTHAPCCWRNINTAYFTSHSTIDALTLQALPHPYKSGAFPAFVILTVSWYSFFKVSESSKSLNAFIHCIVPTAILSGSLSSSEFSHYSIYSGDLFLTTFISINIHIGLICPQHSLLLPLQLHPEYFPTQFKSFLSAFYLTFHPNSLLHHSQLKKRTDKVWMYMVCKYLPWLLSIEEDVSLVFR